MLSLNYHIQQYRRIKDRVWGFKRLFIVHAILTIGCSQLLLLYTLIMQEPNGIRVEEVMLTSGLDQDNLPIDRVFDFSQNDRRIYCFIVMRGLFGLHLKARMLVKWYYSEEQIASHYFQVDSSHPAIVWLDPPTGRIFRRGNYTVEILIQQTLVRTVEFKVD